MNTPIAAAAPLSSAEPAPASAVPASAAPMGAAPAATTPAPIAVPQTFTPVQMLDRLVGFDTVSSKSNLPLITFVADYLRSHGITPEILPNEDGTKANLWATIGPEVAGGVVLSGHTDVVPVDGQAWDTDPFCLTERNGRLYGRGTCDMKGFVALALAAVPQFVATPLARPIHLALSYDEEVGCTGAPGMIAHVVRNRPLPAICIVGEPSMMKPVNAHKGSYAFTVTVRGKEAHSALPDQGASASFAAGEIVAHLSALQDQARAAAIPGSRFEPPYSSFNVGMIQAGTAFNIIPQRAWFSFDYRSLPEEDADAVLSGIFDHIRSVVEPRLQARWPDTGIDVTAFATVPGLRPEVEGQAEALARQLSGSNDVGVVPYGTEGGLFQNAGMSTIIIGPGDIAQAHQPNEFLALDQVRKGEAFLTRLAGWMAR